jgi:DNA-binding protein H-NS
MKLESLDAMQDDDLRAVIGRAEELLKQHDRERKEKALADARSILEAAGLNLRDVASRAKNGKAGKGPVYHGGHQYQHPSRKELVWTAKGQKPNWLRQLEKEGSRAIELPGDVSPRVA